MSPARVLCLGPTPGLQVIRRVDALTVGGVHRVTEVLHAAAGKAVNAARVARALGADVTVLGFLGGATGARVAALLAGEGITCRATACAAETRTCVTLLDAAHGTATEFIDPFPTPPPAAWSALASAWREALPHADCAILAGRMLPGGPRDFYAACVQAAHAAGVRVVLDSQEEAFRLALDARPHVAKCNRVECAATCGLAEDSPMEVVVRAAQALLHAGPEWLLVTDGAARAACRNGTATHWVLPPPVRAVNGVGCGDAMTGALAAALASGQNMRDAVRAGMAAGAADAETELPGAVDAARVAALGEHVRWETHP